MNNTQNTVSVVKNTGSQLSEKPAADDDEYDDEYYEEEEEEEEDEKVQTKQQKQPVNNYDTVSNDSMQKIKKIVQS